MTAIFIQHSTHVIFHHRNSLCSTRSVYDVHVGRSQCTSTKPGHYKFFKHTLTDAVVY